MDRTKSVLALGLIALLLPLMLAAQVPSRPEPVGRGTVNVPDKFISDLARLYYGGHGKELLEKTGLLAGQKIGTHSIDLKCNVYFVVFAVRVPNDELHIVRYLWHAGADADPYASHLAGVRSVFEIVLGAGDPWRIRTSILSTRVANPLAAQLPAVAKKIEPALLALLSLAVPSAERLAETRTKKKKDVPKLACEVREITLPFKRAKIAIDDTAEVAEPALLNGLGRAAHRLAVDLAFRDALGSPYGSGLAKAFAIALNSMAPDPLGAERPLALARTAVADAFNRFVSAHKPGVKDLELAMALEKHFLTLIDDAEVKPLEAEWDFTCEPLERISLGLVGAFLFEDAFTRGRVKLTEAGLYAADPVKGPLSAVIVNIQPWGYDAQRPSPGWRECLKPFAGVVLTPEVGFCAGLGLTIVRGLSIEAGWALLAVSGKNGPQADKPADPAVPFRTRFGGAWFVGLGYGFQ